MLVLERNEDESIVILLPSGETIVVRVLRTKRENGRTTCRLGFDAPPDCEILRDTLLTPEAQAALNSHSPRLKLREVAVKHVPRATTSELAAKPVPVSSLPNLVHYVTQKAENRTGPIPSIPTETKAQERANNG